METSVAGMGVVALSNPFGSIVDGAFSVVVLDDAVSDDDETGNGASDDDAT